MDWSEFEAIVYDALVDAVGEVIHDRPEERFHAAALRHIRREPGGVITLPSLALTTHSLEVRTDVPWDRPIDGWLREDTVRRWQEALFAEACGGAPQRWATAFDRYLSTLARACKGARHTLRARKLTGRDFVVLVLDDEYRDSLIKQVLPVSDVLRLFPELEERGLRPSHSG